MTTALYVSEALLGCKKKCHCSRISWLVDFFTSHQHNNDDIDGGSQRSIFPGVTHPSTNRGRRDLTLVNEPLS